MTERPGQLKLVDREAGEVAQISGVPDVDARGQGGLLDVTDDGDAFPECQGNAFMGNQRHQYLGRFTVEGHEVEMVERLLDDQGWRIRDVAVGPDNGYLYVLIDEANVPLIRLRPADG